MGRLALIGAVLLYSVFTFEMVEAADRPYSVLKTTSHTVITHTTSGQPTSHALSTHTTAAPNTTHVVTNSTTMAPNTTSHAVTNHTTITPNTTTHAVTNHTTITPNTTTHAVTNHTTITPNTTTHAVTNHTTITPNTTTHATTKHTTASYTTSPVPTLAPKPSPPTTGNYTVKNDKVTCILAIIGLELELYNSTKTLGYFNIAPEHTSASGSCGDNKANLKLSFPEGFINFGFVQDKSGYYIEDVMVFLKLSSESWNVNATNKKLLYTDKGYSVKCKNTPHVKVDSSVTLVMTHVKLQAFDIKNGMFGKEMLCSYDRNIIGVAVGLTVVVLVIIGIIIYLIYHKKKSGYQRI
ncbi:lysosome-associated membrane glycoprotein 3 isoform X2 [Spea bombifrons]|uniref:lysosome-associated membrane glycoprotein 3 isoform X2 n=1 Tax=Spea bombifrons TaxID=233779 RepID=UPI00234BEC78|nr:lysosome-associated membrane glycoprotein 3 isoform X2 [Spea bombifrons]